MMPFTHHDVEFTKNGNVFDESQVTAALHALPNYSDVMLVSHGWNNDKAEAKQLYDDLFASLSAVLPQKGGLSGRTFGAIRVYWPSKKFAEDGLIPGGGASLNGAENDDALLKLLEELKRDPNLLGGTETDPSRTATIDQVKALIGSLEHDENAQTQFVSLLRSLLDSSRSSPDDASDQFLNADAKTLFQHFGQPVLAPPPAGVGGAASVGGATGLRDLLSGASAAARRIANYVTYYQMKDRAGIVGEDGVSDLIRRLSVRSPGVRFHLAGHSFGGRLVTAAAAKLHPHVQATSMTLLQAAFSHNGLSGNFAGSRGGVLPEN